MNERRQRSLTDADLQAIVNAVQTHGTCNLGLTTDEATMLKRILRALTGAANLVGMLIITAIVAGIIAIFTKGFWITLFTGIKTAGK